MNKRIYYNPFFLLLFAFVFMGCQFVVAVENPAYAKKQKTTKKHLHKKGSHVAYTAPHISSIIIDYDTNKVLEAENPDALHYPASLTKMMTLYLTFEALKTNHLTLSQSIPVSAHAAGQPQTNISLSVGDHIAVKDAILSIVVRSANDSAVTLGEALGGSEAGFAQQMTRKAARLGMKNTTFRNASGLPEPAQHTTARDMAMLGMALKRDFPQYFPFFKTESFSFRDKTYITHNHVMMRYDGVDGIKTGFIRASGFNLVTSVNRDGHRLVGVVLGGSTWKSRDDHMIALLDKTFTQLASIPANRTQLPASIKNRKLNTLKGSSSEDGSEGEGDAHNDK